MINVGLTTQCSIIISLLHNETEDIDPQDCRRYTGASINHRRLGFEKLWILFWNAYICVIFRYKSLYKIKGHYWNALLHYRPTNVFWIFSFKTFFGDAALGTLVDQAKSPLSCIYIATLLFGVSNGRGNLGYTSACTARSFLLQHYTFQNECTNAFEWKSGLYLCCLKYQDSAKFPRVRNRPLNYIEFC